MISKSHIIKCKHYYRCSMFFRTPANWTGAQHNGTITRTIINNINLFLMFSWSSSLLGFLFQNPEYDKENFIMNNMKLIWFDYQILLPVHPAGRNNQYTLPSYVVSSQLDGWISEETNNCGYLKSFIRLIIVVHVMPSMLLITDVYLVSSPGLSGGRSVIIQPQYLTQFYCTTICERMNGCCCFKG